MSGQTRERRRHFSAERLSEPSQELVHRGFADGKSYDAIIGEVAAAGEKVSRGALSRYWRFWRAQERAREATQDARELLREFKAAPTADLEKLIAGLLASTLYTTIAEADGKEIYLPDLLKGQASLERAKVAAGALELERERRTAVDKPGLFLEFFRLLAETVAKDDPAAAEVLQRHFDPLMARIKETAPA